MSSLSGTRACRLQRRYGMMCAMSRPDDLSFPKTKRLALPAEFARVKGQGTTQRGRLFILGALKEKDERLFRAGFITPKHIGGAVVRNRVRRRLRDIVRTAQPRLRTGLWLVIVARVPAAHATYQQLKDEWLRLAERASILAP
jgi:ribonuclease P protein component